MAGEVVIEIIAQSRALISDAAHMLTDAAAIVLALIAMRLTALPPKGGYTGLNRTEILSAQANALTLLLLGGWLAYEAVHQGHPPSGDSHLRDHARGGLFVGRRSRRCRTEPSVGHTVSGSRFRLPGQ